MKFLVVLLGVLAIAAGGVAFWYTEPSANDDGGVGVGDSVDLGVPEGELTGSSCRRVAGISARLAEQDLAPVAFLRAFGRRVAGIRPRRSIEDLASGGRNRVPGRGFLARFDDGSAGQARHFAGIAVATTYVGGAGPTRWISEQLRGDRPNSADGLLTEEGIEFATEVVGGELELDETPAWLLEHLCRRR